MTLHGERDGDGPRLVLVHGFGQTARCWGPLAPALAADHELVRLDAPGHAGSSDVVADLPTAGRLVAEAGGQATYMGYSMGARLALHVALTAPHAVRGLVLISGTPGIEDPAERARRRARDAELADSIRRGGVHAFVDRWLAQPMFAGLPPEARFDRERRRNTAEGLATSLELAGTGVQRPLWDRLGQLRVPALIVAGADDARYAAIGRRMVALIGARATLAVVPGAGHSTHLERPTATIHVVRAWLADRGL